MTDVLDHLGAALADRYRIERELGAGGMATVYLAEDLKHHRKVALKVLRQELAATLGAERFHREIQIAAQLQHPNILPLLDSGEAGGAFYYAMPYVEGQSLRERLAREGALPIADAVRILRDVVDALTEAHAHGVVHRDIKPENIMLRGRHALVTDFGVAKAISEATGRQTLTTAGVALGTPAYMAPEQASADPHLDHRVDLYAVGAVAYELLTGRPVFMGTTPQMVLSAHVTEAPVPISRYRETVPPALEALVLRCLEKKPADRPQRAEEVLAQLEAMATPSGGITPTSTVPVPAVSGAVAPTRRLPRWTIAAAAVVLLAGIGYGAVRAFRSGAGIAAQSVAVLPFENVGGDSATRAFTDGVHDEILTDLTSIADLQVTSRTSVQEYRSTRKGVRQIASELGVRTLLEGQVQRAGNHVHVSVQLVDAGRDRQLWASSYDRELTAENVFAIQADIAQHVARALQASLTASQVAAVETPPTANLEALDWYHRGKDLFAARAGYNDTAVTAAFARAVGLDSSFAEAWAWLAVARSWEVRDGWTSDTTPARAALARAVALAPSSPETEIAQAFYAYYAKADYDEALTHFRAVTAARPGDVYGIAGIGYIARRRGHWEEALDEERRVVALDPRNAEALRDLGDSYALLRQFDRAELEYRRARILAPANDLIALNLLGCIIIGEGDTARGRAVLADLGPGAPALAAKPMRAFLARWARRVEESNTYLDTVPIAQPIEALDLMITRALNDLAGGDVATARRRADSVSKMAREHITRASLEDVFGNLADWYTALGFAEAIQGRAGEAVADAKRAVELNPMSRDVLEGPRSLEGLIEIHVLLGHRDEAIRLLTEQAARPFGSTGVLPISRAVVRMDPLFDPIRSDPRVQALLANDAAWVVR